MVGSASDIFRYYMFFPFTKGLAQEKKLVILLHGKAFHFLKYEFFRMLNLIYTSVNNGNGGSKVVTVLKVCVCATKSYLLSKLPAFNVLKISISA